MWVALHISRLQRQPVYIEPTILWPQIVKQEAPLSEHAIASVPAMPKNSKGSGLKSGRFIHISHACHNIACANTHTIPTHLLSWSAVAGEPLRYRQGYPLLREALNHVSGVLELHWQSPQDVEDPTHLSIDSSIVK